MFVLSGSVTLTVMADTLALLNRVASASRSGAEATGAERTCTFAALPPSLATEPPTAVRPMEADTSISSTARWPVGRGRNAAAASKTTVHRASPATRPLRHAGAPRSGTGRERARLWRPWVDGERVRRDQAESMSSEVLTCVEAPA